MTDQDKQRIEEAATKYTIKTTAGNVIYDFIKDAFKSGAHSEHPIAYNKALEDVIVIIKKFAFLTNSEVTIISEELQKMRK